MQLIVYGIVNCDSVKKARALLESQGIAYAFHDFKKQGVAAALLAQWVAERGWEIVLNRRGSTWRGLEPAQRDGVVDADSAISVMMANPSTIKRPVVIHHQRTLIGFDELRQAFVA